MDNGTFVQDGTAIFYVPSGGVLTKHHVLACEPCGSAFSVCGRSGERWVHALDSLPASFRRVYRTLESAAPFACRMLEPPAERRQPACARRLVFFAGKPLPTSLDSCEPSQPCNPNVRLAVAAGLQKSGSTSFQMAMEQLGFTSIKLPTSADTYSPADLSHMARNARGPLASMFDRGEAPLAVGDFPIFGLVCQLASAYPEARFVEFTRPFHEWFESQQQDVLCQWMAAEWPVNATDHWALGRSFMSFFWGEPLEQWWAGRRALCANRTDARWRQIRHGFRERFDAHHASTRRCLGNTSRLYSRPLGATAGRGLPEFLGCRLDEPFELPVTNRAGSACVGPVVAISTVDSIDTGGPRALVQLATALARAVSSPACVRILDPLAVEGLPRDETSDGMRAERCPEVPPATRTSQTGRLRRPERAQIHPAIDAAYPDLRAIPLVASSSLGAGDVLILPEHCCCPINLVRRGVKVYMYLLSTRSRALNQRWLASGCHLLSHSFHLSTARGANISADLPREQVIRPYVDADVRHACAGSHPPTKDPLVLIDDDTPRHVTHRVTQACARFRTPCRVAVLSGYNRSTVVGLLRRTKLVIDDCMAGSERVPLEAVLCGAVFMTRECDGGPDARDLGVPLRHVLYANMSSLVGRLERIFDLPRADAEAAFERTAARFVPMRELYSKEVNEESMLNEAKAFVRATLLK